MIVLSNTKRILISKIIPSFFTIKEGSTFLTKPLFPQGREDVTALQCYICPTCPSPAGGSLTHSQALALSKRARDVTALRCSEPLRYKVSGPIKGLAMLCGLGPPGDSSLQLIVYSLRLISWLFADNLQISCDFLGGFEKKRNFASKVKRLK